TVVVRNALASRTAGLASAFGVAGGLLVHTALAVAGLAAVLVTMPVLFRTVQLLGGAYVLYLGLSALYAIRRRPAQDASGTPSVAPEGEPERPAPREFGRALRQGFLTNALNPKAPVLFLSLLPQFVPDGQPPLPRTLLLAALVVVLALIWFPAVALLVDRLGRWLRRPRTARAIEGGSGVALT
ncbi:LysE family translocator, partial [Streptomyces sp. SID7982]|nr:LysE family translocator [Streptomyces sp. SID7982]